MNAILPAVCISLVVLLSIFGDGLVVGMAKLFSIGLVVGAIHIVGRLSRKEATE